MPASKGVIARRRLGKALAVRYTARARAGRRGDRCVVSLSVCASQLARGTEGHVWWVAGAPLSEARRRCAAVPWVIDTAARASRAAAPLLRVFPASCVLPPEAAFSGAQGTSGAGCVDRCCEGARSVYD